jgi:polysaccharide pyruvyl transferase WcaK-like protein
MKLLIENGTYQLLNLGDVAMLQAAVRRLVTRFPHADLQVVTRDRQRLACFCPEARPLAPLTRGPAQAATAATRTNASFRWPSRATHAVRQGLGEAWRRGRQLWLRHQGLPRGKVHPYLNALAECDAIIVTGGGYVSDSWAGHVLQLFGWLDVVRRRGAPIYFVGHGVGPATRADLEAAARRVLPHVRGFTLREGLFSPRWLRRWGVSADRCRVTGDEAIEAAFRQAQAKPGELLGLNVRCSLYSKLTEDRFATLREVIPPLARACGTEFLPFPIACASSHADLETAARLFAPAAVPNPLGIDSLHLRPEDIMRRIGRCRIVLTGSYHGGVFALAQGIPAVCLVGSRYYAQKFYGLQAQFGSACQVVTLDEESFPQRLRDAVADAWQNADFWRGGLLAAAQRQIELANRAYDELFLQPMLAGAA